MVSQIPLQDEKQQNGKSHSSSSSDSLTPKAIFYMTLLAIQYGLQPGLTRTYTSKSIQKVTVILCQEILKLIIAATFLSTSGQFQKAVQNWSVQSWIQVAGLPAMLYALQNVFSLTAYQHLDGLTFTVLNQTKTLSAALCCYLVVGKRQSSMQIIALLLLLTSALTMEGIVSDVATWILKLVSGVESTSDDNATDEASSDPKHWTHGVFPLLGASFISGLAGALCQKFLQGSGGRNPYLFSMELCVASILVLMLSVFLRGELQQATSLSSFLDGWTWKTWIPIVTNSIGGILVGLVTKYAGSVRKGFALIFGIFLSGLLQYETAGISQHQVMGGVLAALSLWMHATNQPKKITDGKAKKE